MNALGSEDAVALVHGDRKCTYGELVDGAGRFAKGLRHHGLRPGQSVAILMPNCIEWVVALYGAAMNGNVVVPLNAMLTSREVKLAMAASDARAIVTGGPCIGAAIAALEGMGGRPLLVGLDEDGEHPTFAELQSHGRLSAPVPYGTNTHSLTMFTSGTSGRPKGAMLSAGNLSAQAEMIQRALTPHPDDRVICALPLFHAFGLNGVLQVALRTGCTVLLQTKFNPEATLRDIVDGGATFFAGVPTMYSYLLAAAGNDRSPTRTTLRRCVSGGAPLSPS